MCEMEGKSACGCGILCKRKARAQAKVWEKCSGDVAWHMREQKRCGMAKHLDKRQKRVQNGDQKQQRGRKRGAKMQGLQNRRSGT